MQKEKFKNLTSKTAGTGDVRFEQGYYLSANYQEPVLFPNRKGTETGHIVFGELR